MGFFEIVCNTGFWIAAAVALLAGFMRGFVGVGSGILMAPVFAILFGPLQKVNRPALPAGGGWDCCSAWPFTGFCAESGEDASP
jgi:uncharacterized membrane protein YfcA